MIRKLAFIGALGALTLGMTGCDDDEATAAAPAAFLSGTAAVGAAMANRTVTVNCAGTTTDLTATTNSSGGYSISADAATAAGATLPCAIKVNFNSIDYLSLVRTGAKANVTPLTNMVVARALANAGVAGTPIAWFNGGADLSTVTATHVTNAVNSIKTALEAAATGTDTVSFDLFTGTLVPGSASDVYDTWLEAFQTAVGANYTTLVTSFATNGTISGITITLPEIPNGGQGTLTITTSVAGIAGTPVTINNSPVPGAQTDFCTIYNAAGGLGYVPGMSNVTCTYNAATKTGTIRGTITQVISVAYVITYRWTTPAV